MTDILVIEDNEELGGLIQDFLRREGYSVEWKMNAEEGLALVKTAAFKLLLLDVMLPGMDGYEALQEIRRDQRIPVLMMSLIFRFLKGWKRSVKDPVCILEARLQEDCTISFMKS